MSTTLSLPFDPLEAVRTRLANVDLRRRVSGYGLALALHALALWALIVLPPALLPRVERAAQAIQVQLYTVAGGSQAESDAPLFEPPLAGGTQGVEGGADSGSATGSAADNTAPDPVEVTEPDPVISEPDQDEPVPELIPLDPVETAAETEESASVPDIGPFPDSDPQAPRQAGPQTSAPPVPPPSTISEARSAGPIATTQPSADSGSAPVRAASGPPSFAEILARAGSQLDPDDFRLLANFGDGVDETVRENFCMSSSDANREAMDCPEGSHLAAARLAQYGLMGLGEEVPEFLEDMDRLAFQLSTLGADDSQLARILTSVREARRETINAGPLARQMARDGRDENGNDVPGAP